jgi:hypothetical protein
VRLTRSPVVELNRAIAVAEVERAEAGLALIERLELDGDQYFRSAASCGASPQRWRLAATLSGDWFCPPPTFSFVVRAR